MAPGCNTLDRSRVEEEQFSREFMRICQKYGQGPVKNPRVEDWKAIIVHGTPEELDLLMDAWGSILFKDQNQAEMDKFNEALKQVLDETDRVFRTVNTVKAVNQVARDGIMSSGYTGFYRGRTSFTVSSQEHYGSIQFVIDKRKAEQRGNRFMPTKYVINKAGLEMTLAELPFVGVVPSEREVFTDGPLHIGFTQMIEINVFDPSPSAMWKHTYLKNRYGGQVEINLRNSGKESGGK